MPGIELVGVTKRYGPGRPAVDDLSLSVEEGELVALLGPSGCGKSTTLRLIAGLERADAGTIRVGNRAVDRASPRDRDVAMVFQNHALYPHLTVFDNLAFGLRARRGGVLSRAFQRVFAANGERELSSGEIRERVVATADRLGLSSLLASYPRRLSGGERQRVALGRAIVREPAAFLFDEPLSNLDAPLREAARRELKRLHRELGTAALFVTHDQAEAMTLGHRVAILREGRLQQIATPTEVYQSPRNVFVARFLGSPGMNVVAGEVRDDGGQPRFRGGGMSVAFPLELRSRLPWSGAVTLGFRPDSFELTDPDSGIGQFVLETIEEHGRFVLETIEELGDARVATLAHGENDRRTVISLKTSGALPRRPLDRVGILLNESRLHWFVTETGDSLRFA